MKYPNNIKKTPKNCLSYSNRGMSLECDLNVTNDYYRESNIAIIHKKPTPIRVVKVEFDSKKNAIIKQAFYEKPSTTDYNGIYKGKYIDFEAKEIKLKDNFPLSNIHNHQIQHLFKVSEHGGISFIIVRFSKYNKTFILTSEFLKIFMDTEKKSIPIEYFNEYGYLINEGYCPRTDYIKIIESLYFGG